jgi:hypothetical protein
VGGCGQKFRSLFKAGWMLSLFLVISIEKLTDKIRTSFIVFKFQGVKSAT